jgi:hypothetical protein
MVEWTGNFEDFHDGDIAYVDVMPMRKLFYLKTLFWIASCFDAVSQTYFDDDKLLKNQTRLDLTGQALLLVREWVLRENLVFDSGIGLGGGYTDLRDDVLNPFWSLTNPALSLYVNPKYYFYRKKVMEICEYCFNNGGAYWGGRIRYVSGAYGDLHFTDLRSTLLSNVHLGFQMGGRSKTMIRGHLGFGYAVTLHNGSGSL